jgi:hypothetical protein
MLFAVFVICHLQLVTTQNLRGGPMAHEKLTELAVAKDMATRTSFS